MYDYDPTDALQPGAYVKHGDHLWVVESRDDEAYTVRLKRGTAGPCVWCDLDMTDDEIPWEISANTIQDFIDHIGVGPLSQALRAIDRHNLEHVWLVLADGSICTRTGLHEGGWRGEYRQTKTGHLQLRSEQRANALNLLPLDTPVLKVGAGCIAWDGSNWEHSSERAFLSTVDIDAVRQECLDAYDEYKTEPPDPPDDDDITTLRRQAGKAGDLSMVAICDRALDGDEEAITEVADAIQRAEDMDND